MTIDHYAPCPCGSGKKLKFCKCVEQPQDLERIVKLIDGGQELAALDRINQMLAKTPNTAWLLAIKGELALGMQDVGMFKDTANRFLKLKPDNPLALIMRSMVATIDHEPVENAARYLLQGMSESRDELPSLTLPAIRIMIQSLAATGKLSLVGYWSDILNALTPEENKHESNDSQQQDARLNLLAKSPTRVIADPPNSAWKERLNEVLSLIRTFRYAQAESKLRLILRDFPDQPGPLSHLLRAQSAQLDQNGAHATARKLAQHNELSQEDRAYFAAIAVELEPEHKSLQIDLQFRYCRIDSVERVEQALEALDFIDAAEREGLEEAKSFYAALVDDEVPAKRLFTAYSGGLEPVTGERRIVSSIATIVLFGKQTDKPARAMFMFNPLPRYAEALKQVEDTLQLEEAVDASDLADGSHYAEYLRRSRFAVGDGPPVLSLEETGAALVEDFLELPIKLLGDMTPLEAAADERKRSDLLSLLSHLEGEQAFIVPRETIGQLYARLDLQRPVVRVPSDSQPLRLTNILDLDRIDPARLSDSQLKGLLFQSLLYGAPRVFYHTARHIIERPSMAGDRQVLSMALSGLISFEPILDDKLQCAHKLETVLAAIGAPVGRVVLQQVGLLSAAGRHSEAEHVMREAVQKYPADPYLLNFMQYAMQSQSGGRPAAVASDDLALRMMMNAPKSASADAPQSGSGLVLPGQEQGTSSSGSKLWLPGS